MNDTNHHLKQTPSQTAGPYVHIALVPDEIGHRVALPRLDHVPLWPKIQDNRIEIKGVIYDGAQERVKDAAIEFWQSNGMGEFIHGAASVTSMGRGWGRSFTNFETGEFTISTVKPGSSIDKHGLFHAPHISLWIVARGLNDGVFTRIYFDDEAKQNAKDRAICHSIPSARLHTLLAQKTNLIDNTTHYRFDIVLQGDDETVFFDL